MYFLKIEKLKDLKKNYDQNKNRPQLKTPEKVFHGFGQVRMPGKEPRRFLFVVVCGVCGGVWGLWCGCGGGVVVVQRF